MLCAKKTLQTLTARKTLQKAVAAHTRERRLDAKDSQDRARQEKFEDRQARHEVHLKFKEEWAQTINDAADSGLMNILIMLCSFWANNPAEECEDSYYMRSLIQQSKALLEKKGYDVAVENWIDRKNDGNDGSRLCYIQLRVSWVKNKR